MGAMTQVCEAFAALAELCIALDAAPATKHERCWEQQIDERWWIAFNGHKEPVGCSDGSMVEPFHCYVKYCGWPAGVFAPWGGVIAAGEAANEEIFLAAVRARMPQ